MLRPLIAALALGGCVALGFAGPAGAQVGTYPDSTVRFVVPTNPGGPLDILGRLIGQRLKDIWGQPVIVDNRPGAALMLGANVVARAAPDGLTLLLANDGPITINPNLYSKMMYDPRKDLAPVTMIVDLPFILVVNAAVKAANVAEFVALAKASPGKMSFASGGNTSRLAAERFRLMTGIDVVNVSYRGSGQAIQGVVAGEVQMMIDGLASSLPHVDSGKLRALGVTSSTRLKERPDIPTVAETVADYTGGTWLGMFAPGGTPQPILDKIRNDVAKVLQEPELRDRLVKLGMYPVASTPAEFAKMLDAEEKEWARVIREAKIPKAD